MRNRSDHLRFVVDPAGTFLFAAEGALAPPRENSTAQESWKECEICS
jgi:hypothetical protein